MVIIVEGPDGSGKSTLVKQICKELNYEELEHIPRKYPGQYNLWNVFLSNCINSGKNYVIDRCFISELVYRCCMNDKYPNITMSRIIDLLYNYKVLYIFCENENSFSNAVQRGETYVTDKNSHDTIVKAYDLLFAMIHKFTTCFITKYDYSKQKFKHIKEIINECENCSRYIYQN